MQQCQAAGVACFVKQLWAKPMAYGTYTQDGLRELRDRKGGDPSEWPADLNVREFPDADVGSWFTYSGSAEDQ